MRNISRNVLEKIDERQITHLICARLEYDLYDFFRGCFGAFYIRKTTGSRPKTPLKKSYRSYFRRAQIRWIIWRSLKKTQAFLVCFQCFTGVCDGDGHPAMPVTTSRHCHTNLLSLLLSCTGTQLSKRKDDSKGRERTRAMWNVSDGDAETGGARSHSGILALKAENPPLRDQTFFLFF